MRIKLSSFLLIATIFFIVTFPSIGHCQSLELFQERDTTSIPGEVQYIGEKKTEPVGINVIKYNEGAFEEKEVDSAQAAKDMIEDGFVTWIDVNGVHDEELIEDFGEVFNLSPSVQEDIANTTILPKKEDQDEYLFWTLKMLNRDFDVDSAKMEQISLLLGKNYIISFQENNDNDFSAIYERLVEKRGNIPKMGSDYLAFVLTDVVVDSYFPAADAINEKINETEKQLINSPDEQVLQDLYKLKRELTAGRQAIVPMRDVIHDLASYDYALISSEAKDYFHITYENMENLSATLETFSNIITDMVNYYISIYGHETNHILKFLTIVSTVLFIVSLIAAIYGMNLSQFHTKKNVKRGHFITASLMVAVAALIVLLFVLADWI